MNAKSRDNSLEIRKLFINRAAIVFGCTVELIDLRRNVVRLKNNHRVFLVPVARRATLREIVKTIQQCCQMAGVI